MRTLQDIFSTKNQNHKKFAGNPLRVKHLLYKSSFSAHARHKDDTKAHICIQTICASTQATK
jgi:hypothetical protein